MKKVLYTIFIILVFSFIILSVFFSKLELKNVKKNTKYTVAYITSNWHQKNINGMGTDFIYKVNGNIISKTTHYDLKKGRKYLVMYDSLNPSWYIMLGRHQLPDSIEAPPNGWKFNEIPIDSAELKQYFKELGMD